MFMNSICLSVVCLPVLIPTVVMYSGCHIIFVYYNMFCVENGACSIYNSFTETLESVPLHYSQRSQNAFDYDDNVSFHGYLLMMLHHFKHNEIKMNLEVH